MLPRSRTVQTPSFFWMTAWRLDTSVSWSASSRTRQVAWRPTLETAPVSGSTVPARPPERMARRGVIG